MSDLKIGDRVLYGRARKNGSRPSGDIIGFSGYGDALLSLPNGGQMFWPIDKLIRESDAESDAYSHLDL